jgi:hypothetical protein
LGIFVEIDATASRFMVRTAGTAEVSSRWLFRHETR